MSINIAGQVSERVFDQWEMLHDPEASWIWTQDEIADGAIDRATPEEIIAFFTRLNTQRRDW